MLLVVYLSFSINFILFVLSKTDFKEDTRARAPKMRKIECARNIILTT